MQAQVSSRQPDPVLADRVAHLKKVSLFGDIHGNESALQALAGLMHERSFKPGTNIITEGETGSEMFLLTAGQASVSKSTAEGESYKVAILTGDKHAFFGEGGLLDTDARSATIAAESECHCVVLDRAGFDQFSQKHPEWALPILLRISRAVLARLRKANGDLTLLYNALVSEIRG